MEVLELLAVDKKELFGNVITSHIKSLILDRATAAWCNASELQLNIKFTDWSNATKTKEKRTKRDGTWRRMTGGGGSTLSTVSWGGWTLALIGAVIGTNEPSIAPTTLAKPANV